jgi:hypothetical protein
LAPVYKTTNGDEEIALEDFSAPSTAPTTTPKSCCGDKSEDSCCSDKKDGKKKIPMGRRIARCFFATLLVGLCLWMITGTAMLTYIGAKAHRCLHPRHVAVSEFSWTPASLPTLELGVVTGTLNIRSCPKATNISLTVRAYAGTEDLLNTMVISREALTTGAGDRVVLLAPSFDWAHCQRAVFDLVVPEGAGLDIKAQALVGRVDVRASKSAVRNLVISSSVGHVDVHDTQISGVLRVDSELGMVRAREVDAQDVHVEVRTGYLEFRRVTATVAVRTTLRIGRAVMTHVTAATEFVHSSELAYVSMWDAAAPTLTARVDYGSLRVAVDSTFNGHFIARSPYGFLRSETSADVKDRYNLIQDTPAITEGTISPAADQTGTAKQTATLDAVYGSVEFFVPNAETRFERSHRRP